MASVALWLFWFLWLFGFLRLVCSLLPSSRAPGLLRLLSHILLTFDDHGMALLMLLMVLILMLLRIKLLVLMTLLLTFAVDRLLTIINNIIPSVTNTSNLIISNIKINVISSIKSTIRMIINLTQTKARHPASDTEQHPPKEKTRTKEQISPKRRHSFVWQAQGAAQIPNTLLNRIGMHGIAVACTLAVAGSSQHHKPSERPLGRLV